MNKEDKIMFNDRKHYRVYHLERDNLPEYKSSFMHNCIATLIYIGLFVGLIITIILQVI